MQLRHLSQAQPRYGFRKLVVSIYPHSGVGTRLFRFLMWKSWTTLRTEISESEILLYWYRSR